MANLEQRSDGSAAFDRMGVEWYSVSFTLSAEGAGAADAIDVTLQLTGRNGTPIKKAGVAVLIYPGIISGASGALSGATSGSPLGALVSNGGALVMTIVAGRFLVMATDANGKIGFRHTQAGGVAAVYDYVVLPDGRVIESPLLTFA